jgi:ribosomal protein L6P/L9E
MSRIGKLPITLPAKVEVSVSSDNTVTVKGPKGTLSQKVDPDIAVKVDGEDAPGLSVLLIRNAIALCTVSTAHSSTIWWWV